MASFICSEQKGGFNGTLGTPLNPPLATASSLGFYNLKDEQLEVMTSFLCGNVFAVLPTGFGKSLCYACLPGAFDKLRKSDGSIVIVISPLTALIKDQVSIN